MTHPSDNYSHEVARIIRRQIQIGVLMALGASNLRHGYVGTNPALFMDVRVLAYKADGDRSGTVRRMTLTVELTAGDDYTVTVSYLRNGRTPAEVIHEQYTRVYVDELNAVLLGIDSMKPSTESSADTVHTIKKIAA